MAEQLELFRSLYLFTWGPIGLKPFRKRDGWHCGQFNLETGKLVDWSEQAHPTPEPIESFLRAHAEAQRATNERLRAQGVIDG